jgi:ABC-2 type transport system ATP-binding protein
MYAITAEFLSKTYRSGLLRKREVAALAGFSVSVEPGQIFSLLGPNGAGKTTFIKILLSLTRPTAGSATILGTPVPTAAVRSRVGYLPENHRYPGYLTGDQVLRFFGRLGGLSREAVAARVGPLIEMVGLAQWRGMKVKRYSKGMVQRLGLAQAMVNDPDVLFLDEPTDGVDPVGRKEIRDILRELRGRGKTIFLNSHLLSEVELVSDRVAILDKGRLVKTGTVDELTARGSLYRIGIVGALTESLHAEAKAMVLPLRHDGDSVQVELGDLAELNRLIDLLRRHSVQISSIVRERSTLEESFISLLTKEVKP